MTVAVVTGASSGIGHATARTFAEQGFEVIVAARRFDRLEKLAAEIGATAIELDTTDIESVQNFAEKVPHVDMLINVAGGAFGTDSVLSADISDWKAMYELNVIGTLQVTQALFPQLRNSPVATIVNVTSTASIVNYEGGGGYTAAKHAEHALNETLRLELCGEPVRVIEILPGMVKTEEFSANRYRGNQSKADAVYEGVDHPLIAEDIAECISFAVNLPMHVNINQIVVRPLAQAAQHKIYRGNLFS